MFRLVFEAKTMRELKKVVDHLVDLDDGPKMSVTTVENVEKVSAPFTPPEFKTHVPAVIPAVEEPEIYPEEIKVEPAPEFVENSAPSPVTPFNGLDSQGIPWDERIHSANKSRSSEGEWRRRRNIEDTEFFRIVDELKKKTAAAGVIPTTPPSVSPAAAPIFPIKQETVAVVPEVIAPLVPPPAPVIPGQLHAHNLQSFKANIVGVLSTLINEKKVTQAYINTLKEYFGVTEIWQMFNNDEQVAELFNGLVSNGLIAEVQ